MKGIGFLYNDYLRMRSMRAHVCREYIRNSQVTVIRTIEINILQSIYRSSDRLTKYCITEKKQGFYF